MLEIECVMHGALEDYLPESCQSNRIRLSFETRPSVDDILTRLNIDPEELQFALAEIGRGYTKTLSRLVLTRISRNSDAMYALLCSGTSMGI